jgi:integrase
LGRKKTRRSNGEGSVFKTNDGLWKGEYQIGTDPFTGAPKKKYFQGKTQREVLQQIKAVQMKESLGISLEDEKMRYSKWLETWFHEYHARSVAPKTAADNYRLINDYIKPRLGKKRIGAISTHDVQMFINELSRNGKVRGKGGLSYNSIRLILNIVRTSLSQAVINHTYATRLAEAGIHPKIIQMLLGHSSIQD